MAMGKSSTPGKYGSVKSRLDTGPNMRKILAQYEGTSGPNAHRRAANEYFQRLRPTTLAKLLEPAMEAEESVYKIGHDETMSVVSSVAANSEAAAQGGNLLL